MNFVMVLLAKAKVYNGILMETIGISVMVSIVFISRVSEPYFPGYQQSADQDINT